MKKERGAITLITLVTILFMLAFLVSTFTIIMNRRQSQAEIKRETKERRSKRRNLTREKPTGHRSGLRRTV